MNTCKRLVLNVGCNIFFQFFFEETKTIENIFNGGYLGPLLVIYWSLCNSFVHLFEMCILALESIFCTTNFSETNITDDICKRVSTLFNLILALFSSTSLI